MKNQKENVQEIIHKWYTVVKQYSAKAFLLKYWISEYSKHFIHDNQHCNLTILNDYSKYIEIQHFSPNDRNQLQKCLKLDNVYLQAFIDSIAKCFINNISYLLTILIKLYFCIVYITYSFFFLFFLLMLLYFFHILL